MTEDVLSQLDNVNDEFALIVKDSNSLIEEINFQSEEEKLICNSIIDNMERCIATNLKAEKCVNIPYVGNLRKNQVNLAISKHKKNLSLVRKHMTKEEYKEHVREYVKEAKDNQERLDKEKFELKKLRNKFKKTYTLLYTESGRTHAELYIKVMRWFKPVPFDQDVQDAYDNLKK